MVFSDLAGFRGLHALLCGRCGWDLLVCRLRVLGVGSAERGGYEFFPGGSLDSPVASSVLECDTRLKLQFCKEEACLVFLEIGVSLMAFRSTETPWSPSIPSFGIEK